MLAGRVCTRWYRAPEIILLDREYSGAVDVWCAAAIAAANNWRCEHLPLPLLTLAFCSACRSLGCIFAELLHSLSPDFEGRRPLFMGDSCYPLSDCSGKQYKCRSYTDLLCVI